MDNIKLPKDSTMKWKLKPASQKGWECPKCSFVWAIWVKGCENCNQIKDDFARSQEDRGDKGE